MLVADSAAAAAVAADDDDFFIFAFLSFKYQCRLERSGMRSIKYLIAYGNKSCYAHCAHLTFIQMASGRVQIYKSAKYQLRTTFGQ